ncbi:MAG: lipid-A-disaccharide synthase N-terminal domain-containing protein [Candidatus Paracaedibacteraceae bacterium]|nr:lipid-A-disaccharide synthase N-terminal domain-containing protein [Candidatus Paracaedibacteraceae bacterium]
MTLALFWKIFGFVGQLLFGGRFLAQWLASEKVKKSIIPNSFWILSLSGGLVLFVYAIHIQDPVFIVGQGLGLFIYARNLFFVKTNRVP